MLFVRNPFRSWPFVLLISFIDSSLWRQRLWEWPHSPHQGQWPWKPPPYPFSFVVLVTGFAVADLTQALLSSFPFRYILLWKTLSPMDIRLWQIAAPPSLQCTMSHFIPATRDLRFPGSNLPPRRSVRCQASADSLNEAHDLIRILLVLNLAGD